MVCVDGVVERAGGLAGRSRRPAGRRSSAGDRRRRRRPASSPSAPWRTARLLLLGGSLGRPGSSPGRGLRRPPPPDVARGRRRPAALDASPRWSCFSARLLVALAVGARALVAGSCRRRRAACGRSRRARRRAGGASASATGLAADGRGADLGRAGRRPPRASRPGGRRRRRPPRRRGSRRRRRPSPSRSTGDRRASAAARSTARRGRDGGSDAASASPPRRNLTSAGNGSRPATREATRSRTDGRVKSSRSSPAASASRRQHWQCERWRASRRVSRVPSRDSTAVTMIPWMRRQRAPETMSSYSSVSRRRARNSVDSTAGRLMPMRLPISW